MTTYSTPFMQKPDAGFRLGDIRSMFDSIVTGNGVSQAYGIAGAGTTQATATPLTSVYNQVDTAAASTGVNLPSSRGARTVPFSYCVIINNGASTLTVYAAQGTTDTINGTAGATGISLPAGKAAGFVSAKPGAWFSSDVGEVGNFTSITVAGNITETTVGSGFIQKLSATGTGRAGTFTLNGTTTVTVTNTTVATSDFIGISLNTVGGTVGVFPHIVFVQPGTAFAVLGTASDTSTYNYTMIGVN